MSSKLTIGYIGNGKSTNRYHLPFSLKLKDLISVKRIFSPVENTGWPKIDGISYTTNIDDLLNDDEIQAVIIQRLLNSIMSWRNRLSIKVKTVLSKSLLLKPLSRLSNFSVLLKRKA